jgi:LuxR family quorum sensing-dependent transcriptional regulator
MTADLHMTLRDFIDEVGELKTPDAVLDALHVVSTISLPLNVLGAARFPRVATDWGSIKLGKSVFLHGSVPKGWWEEYVALADKNFTPALFLARTSLASFTWTETRRALEPIGVDRWSEELALKYGMRDGLTYPVGARWVVVFWSPKVLTDLLSRSVRFLLCAAANLAAQRLEQLAGPDVGRLGTRPRLTPRETAVLRLVSMGRQSAEIAKALDLGEETVRSHLKKAQAKLGAHNRTQAACEALRQNLIP